MAEVDPALVERILSTVRVRAWRLHLETPGVLATVPMLRGVWGAALHSESAKVYQQLFVGGEGQVPRYVLRPAPLEARPAPAIELFLFGELAIEDLDAAWSAWDRAGAMGLGPERRPFRVAKAVPLAWDETPLRPDRVQPGFTLADLPWPLDQSRSGCRLEFPAPLRLIYRRRLVERPTPADLVIAILRRIHAFAPGGPHAASLWESRRGWLERAHSLPCLPWEGRRLDLVRYSGSQQAELELRGVAGSLGLIAGPGPLGPLLKAASWLHIGKGSVMGMGQLRIRPLDRPNHRPTTRMEWIAPDRAIEPFWAGQRPGGTRSGRSVRNPRGTGAGATRFGAGSSKSGSRSPSPFLEGPKSDDNGTPLA